MRMLARDKGGRLVGDLEAGKGAAPFKNNNNSNRGRFQGCLIVTIWVGLGLCVIVAVVYANPLLESFRDENRQQLPMELNKHPETQSGLTDAEQGESADR